MHAGAVLAIALLWRSYRNKPHPQQTFCAVPSLKKVHLGHAHGDLLRLAPLAVPKELDELLLAAGVFWVCVNSLDLLLFDGSFGVASFLALLPVLEELDELLSAA